MTWKYTPPSSGYADDVRKLVRLKYLAYVAALSTVVAALIALGYLGIMLTEGAPTPRAALDAAYLYLGTASASVLLLGFGWSFHYFTLSGSDHAEAARLPKLDRFLFGDFYRGLSKFGNPVVAPFFVAYWLVKLAWTAIRSLYRRCRPRRRTA